MTGLTIVTGYKSGHERSSLLEGSFGGRRLSSFYSESCEVMNTWNHIALDAEASHLITMRESKN